jgi:hypothetical protein
LRVLDARLLLAGSEGDLQAPPGCHGLEDPSILAASFVVKKQSSSLFPVGSRTTTMFRGRDPAEEYHRAFTCWYWTFTLRP